MQEQKGRDNFYIMIRNYIFMWFSNTFVIHRLYNDAVAVDSMVYDSRSYPGVQVPPGDRFQWVRQRTWGGGDKTLFSRLKISFSLENECRQENNLYPIFLFLFDAPAPPPHPTQRARPSSFTRSLDHTQRRTTVGRTPLDEWSAHRRDLYLTTHSTHNRQTDMPPMGFEQTIPASERPQTHALDGAATGTGI